MGQQRINLHHGIYAGAGVRIKTGGGVDKKDILHFL
jgi:hypothetical protein